MFLTLISIYNNIINIQPTYSPCKQHWYSIREQNNFKLPQKVTLTQNHITYKYVRK
jgi:hypothetical protein